MRPTTSTRRANASFAPTMARKYPIGRLAWRLRAQTHGFADGGWKSGSVGLRLVVMRKLNLGLCSVALAACGSDAAKTSDAPPVAIDAKPIDAAKVFLDAPPPAYDLSCYQHTAPAAATDPVTISGTTQTLNGTLGPLATVNLEVYKNGSATALATTASDANGVYAFGNVVTGGVPVNGYIKGTKATYRTTYLYPPNEVVANLANVPVPLISIATASMYISNQNDTNNGLLFLTVADCTLTPIAGATLTVKQNGANVGTQIDLGSFFPQLHGVYIVSNVPDGDATISAMYNSMTFPSHVVASHKRPSPDAPGTVTASAVVPGFF